MFLAMLFSSFAYALEGESESSDGASSVSVPVAVAAGLTALLVGVVSYTCLWWNKQHRARKEVLASGIVRSISGPQVHGPSDAVTEDTKARESPRATLSNASGSQRPSSGNASGSPRASSGNASGVPRLSSSSSPGSLHGSSDTALGSNASGSPRPSANIVSASLTPRAGAASGSIRSSASNVSASLPPRAGTAFGSPRTSSGNASGSSRADARNVSASLPPGSGTASGSQRASAINVFASLPSRTSNASGILSTRFGALAKSVSPASSQSANKCANDGEVSYYFPKNNVSSTSFSDIKVAPQNTARAPPERRSPLETSLPMLSKTGGENTERPSDMLAVLDTHSNSPSSCGSQKSMGTRGCRSLQVKKMEAEKIVVPKIVLIPGNFPQKLSDEVKAGIPFASRTRSRSVLHIGWHRGMPKHPPASRQASMPAPRRKIIVPVNTRTAVHTDDAPAVRMSDLPSSFSRVSAPVNRKRGAPSTGTLRMSDMPACFATVSGKLPKEDNAITLADLPPTVFKIKNANEPRPGTEAMRMSEMSVAQMRFTPVVTLVSHSPTQRQRALAHKRSRAASKAKVLEEPHKSGACTKSDQHSKDATFAVARRIKSSSP